MRTMTEPQQIPPAPTPRRSAPRWIWYAAALAIAAAAIVTTAIMFADRPERSTTAIATTSAPKPPAAGVTVTSLQDLAERVDCPNLKRNPAATNALEMGSCDDNTVLSTYENHTEVRRAMNAFWSFQNELDPDNTILGPSKLLLGENWMINCGSYDLTFCWAAQKAIGGEIVIYER